MKTRSTHGAASSSACSRISKAIMKNPIDLAARAGLWSGNRPPMHRAMRTMEFPAHRWLQVLLLPLGFNIVTFLSLGTLAGFWTDFFSLWMTHLDLRGEAVSMALVNLPGHALLIPSLTLTGGVPTATGWLVHVGVTLACALLSMWIPGKYLPFRYILRFLVFIHGTALLYFAFLSASFPYDLETYVRNGLISAIVLLFILPWILAATYYIYDFSIARKIGITTLMLVYFAIFSVTQFLVHALCLHAFSALMLPLLYLVFGVFLDVMFFMALYAWAMSLK